MGLADLIPWKFSVLGEFSGTALEDHCQEPSQHFLPEEAEPLGLKQSEWKGRAGGGAQEQYGSENGIDQVDNTRNSHCDPESRVWGPSLCAFSASCHCAQLGLLFPPRGRGQWTVIVVIIINVFLWGKIKEEKPHISV